MAKSKNISTSQLALMTAAAVISLRGLPMMAQEELTMFFYIFFATFLFLIPAALVGAELGSAFAAKGGGVYTWVKEAFNPHLGFTAIFLQWIQNVVWYPTVLGFAAASIAYTIGLPALAQNGPFVGLFSIAMYWFATWVTLRGTSAISGITSRGFLIGTVLYDSEVDASRLESHAGREEFQQARENGEAFTARSSATLGQTSLYYAKRLADGRVIRVSGTQRGMLRQVRDLLGYLLLGAVLCFGAAMAFSRPLAKRLAAPMNEVNLDQPLESDVYEELSPMLRRMAQQNARIADQMASLTAQRHELDTVLGGMKEGFVILDEKRHVLTMNNAARAMFCITNDPVGQPMIAVSRDEALLRLLDGQGTECAMQLNGMTIHLSRSHVEGGGTALLMQDVTAAQAAEASRRQFSANVSHELRTPLTTISGYAELLSSGMLQKPEDATEFGRKILAESRRLLTLIEDIIRLSRLDEGVRGEVTPVDLTALIQHCVQKLTPAAQNAQVSISASGNDPVLISGDHALLEEMLTNLLENGIKYNHAGGYVRVRAEMADGRAVVTVADNGVGIAPEDQQRVFERFYRVDKSRSKQTGGTGLGLSIVKHGAQVHHAQIAMQSALGEGTTITLTFPAQSSGKK